MSHGIGPHKKSEVKADVLRVLRAEGMTFQQVHFAVGSWSLISIKHALRELREEGIAIRGGTHERPLWRKA